ncbi:hypothetical protein [Algoriphagus sediminis]|uniref:Glycoside hydrolase family 5 domain-containing protein n=1 Tax=Algoriphagus sediminis TaxID=3057113 RepID=A0ABT7YB49_9BACT|nr:hypothetical protein [Algoriphagus sediminis]MDN3203751.1 hypothetical protein [Algoriphagus sediminis]
MKKFTVLLCLVCSHFGASAQEPIKLLEANPHYFEYKGEPLVLVTSAEHYGALINTAFDFETYLKTLKRDGMNYTRIFMGSYFEIPGDSFGIKHNTLAPDNGEVLVPWEMKEENGQIKYNWAIYNPRYFERLHEFMSLAQELDIIVEVTFFSSIYRDEHWDISPQNPKNRLNAETKELDRRLVHTLENGELLSLQKGYVQKIVQELNSYDNFFFEIQNEPWSDRGLGVLNLMNLYVTDGPDWTQEVDYADQLSLDWQNAMVETIVSTESELPQKHLIAQNFTNFKAPLFDVHPEVSIVNFHYNWPESAEWNYHLDKVIGFDESGFAGNEDWVYRRQAWAFMMSGGGLFNHLDYSFFVGKEDGTGINEAPGGGSPEFRKEMKILSDFLHSLNLENSIPAKNRIKASPGLLAFALEDGDGGIAVYAIEAGKRDSSVSLEIDPGKYEVHFLDPISGEKKLITTAEISADELVLTMSLEKGEGLFHVKRKK